MTRASSVAQTGHTVRPLATAARRLALAGRSCSKCGSLEIRPSRSRNALDILLACLLLAPFRCRVCRERFYRVRRPSLLRPPDPPIAPLFVMPARRGVLNIETVSRRPIDPQALPSERNPPRRIPPVRKAAPPRSAFIERLEAGLRSPRPLPPLPAGAILILESDLSIRKLLRRLLERRGYCTVEIAQTSDVSIELANRLTDLLVMDVSDSSGRGLEAAVALARAHPGLKVLALSAEHLANNEIPGRLLALPKPFALDRFIECVNRLMQR